MVSRLFLIPIVVSRFAGITMVVIAAEQWATKLACCTGDASRDYNAGETCVPLLACHTLVFSLMLPTVRTKAAGEDAFAGIIFDFNCGLG